MTLRSSAVRSGVRGELPLHPPPRYRGNHRGGVVSRARGVRMTWQPIETAPRDGTRVLLVSHDNEHVRIGSWDRRRWIDDGEGLEIDHVYLWQPIPEVP